MYDAQLNGGADFADAAGLPAGFRNSAAFTADRRSSTGVQAALLVSMLDEIDYGLLVLGAGARILLANQLARLELGAERFVRRRQDKVVPSLARHGAQMEAALESVRRGQRSLVTLRCADAELALSFVPLNSGELSSTQRPDAPLALVIFGRRDACEALTLQQYGRLSGLTGAEQALLPAIIRGLSVEAIARQQCVSLSTVRSQLGSIREKTGVKSLRSLAARLTSLPPIRPLFKQAPAH
jgi:DNA-binding NarL/FixJ family response regulator